MIAKTSVILSETKLHDLRTRRSEKTNIPNFFLLRSPPRDCFIWLDLRARDLEVFFS